MRHAKMEDTVEQKVYFNTNDFSWRWTSLREKRLSKSKGSEVPVTATTVEIYVRQQGRHSIRLAGKLRSPVVRVNGYNF